ncbi:hypothetical protein BZG36_00200 [Bifiguratus adelaidae]|uniref:Uncharacterized protein n=1 Tax=Bifiguratus adelaidae TaxID=1938954 RepID=A0A261Y8X0_9FUNG|nr:hypothetical protein BZG36_00200 [Bifiguratus adelaidae]
MQENVLLQSRNHLYVRQLLTVLKKAVLTRDYNTARRAFGVICFCPEASLSEYWELGLDILWNSADNNVVDCARYLRRVHLQIPRPEKVRVMEQLIKLQLNAGYVDEALEDLEPYLSLPLYAQSAQLHLYFCTCILRRWRVNHDENQLLRISRPLLLAAFDAQESRNRFFEELYELVEHNIPGVSDQISSTMLGYLRHQVHKGNQTDPQSYKLLYMLLRRREASPTQWLHYAFKSLQADAQAPLEHVQLFLEHHKDDTSETMRQVVDMLLARLAAGDVSAQTLDNINARLTRLHDVNRTEFDNIIHAHNPWLHKYLIAKLAIAHDKQSLLRLCDRVGGRAKKAAKRHAEGKATTKAKKSKTSRISPYHL